MQELILKNLITILFIMFVVFSFMSGFAKGFLKMVISFGSLIVSIVLTRMLTPTTAETIKNITNIESSLTSAIYDAITKTNIYDKIDLPFMKNAIDTGNIENMLRDNVCNGLANAIINLFCGIALFIAIFIALKIMVKALDVVNYIPLVGQLNKILGGVLGVVETIFVVWIIFAVLKTFESVPQIKILVDNINSSFLVGQLYQNNVIYNIFANLFSGNSQPLNSQNSANA